MTAFAELTTLRVGGPIADLLTVEDDAEAIAALSGPAGSAAFVLGGGSNLLVADAPFDGTVVRIATRGVEVRRDSGRALVDVAAGEPWDEVVEFSVGQGWSGIDALAGIPGLTGATPIQNVGAYGQEVADVIDHVTVLDRASGEVVALRGDACGFGYRTSRFKRDPGAFVVLSVAFVLREGPTPVRYAQLADALGVAVGSTAPAADVRAAVLALRREKGMVLDPSDPDTRSAGSFFMNPVVDEATAAALDGPAFPVEGGMKLSAAWLIERAGIARGFSLDGRVRVSTKHALAIANASGEATADDVLALARVIRDRVRESTGVTLEPEPTLVGCSL